MEETDTDATVKILNELKESYEKHHSVIIDNSAIMGAVALSKRYIPDRYLPDKALDLLDEACARVSLKNANVSSFSSELKEKIRQISIEKESAVKNKDFLLANSLHEKESEYIKKLHAEIDRNGDNAKSANHVTEEDIKIIVTEITGITVSDMERCDTVNNLRDRLSEKIIGQEKAVELLSAAVIRSKVGLSDPEKPRGVFLFIGESGVGKTAMGYALAKILFPDKESIIKLDMSEFGEKHSVSKIIGAPPGYVGYEDGGALTEKIRRRPYSVVLFDEIEKASPEVQNLLLQIMDEGVLTDSTGRRVSFKHTYIIMTSNIGADGINKNSRTGFISDVNGSERNVVLDKLKKYLKPEFINRIDEISPFSKLSYESLVKIADSFMKKLRDKLNAIGINFVYSEKICEYIAKKGEESGFGARPISRLITQEIENKISMILLENNGFVAEISAVLNDGKIVFYSKPRAETKIPITNKP